MPNDTTFSLIIIGGGITGLTLAVVAQARGHAVTVVADEVPATTASGVAAGMIAPVQEAFGEADPVAGFLRLKAAQSAWTELLTTLPVPVQTELTKAMATPSVYLDANPAVVAALVEAGAHIEAGEGGVAISGDWLVDAAILLQALQSSFLAAGGRWHETKVSGLSAQSVTTKTGTLTADAVVVAAGFGAAALAADVPSLNVLTPIRGQLLAVDRFDPAAPSGVVRNPRGYWARSGAVARFGATMEARRSDREPDAQTAAAQVEKLEALLPGVYCHGEPQVGIRASTPDGWPLIGRDTPSGVYVAVGMRRNGYVFAAFAARRILGLIEGAEAAADDPYAPNRFKV